VPGATGDADVTRRDHAHADEYRRPDIGTDGLALFSQPAESPPPPPEPSARADRKVKARRLRDARWRRWIDAGKPVALAVVRANGTVTAESFRIAAEPIPGVLPPAYGDDRTGSYVSSMFAEMVRDGTLRKRVREDGSVVKEYSETNRNEHVIYELAERVA
jgi:hypothetical protein